MTQGKHFAAGGDHFAALPNKKIHTPKGIARLTVTAATMAAMTGSSLISPFTAFAQTGDGGTQHPAVMSPIAAHAGAASGTGAKSAAQTIADLQKAVDEAKAKEDAAKASYDEAAGPYNEAASARDQAKASYDSAVSAGTAADRAAMDEYARQVAEGKDAADAAGKDLEQAKAGLADAKADASEKDDQMKVTADGQQYDTDNFRNLYQVLMSIYRKGAAPAEPAGDPVLSIKLVPTTASDGVVELSIYKHDPNVFIVRFTTGETYAVNASEVNEAVKQLGNYLEGKDVKVN